MGRKVPRNVGVQGTRASFGSRQSIGEEKMDVPSSEVEWREIKTEREQIHSEEERRLFWGAHV